MSLIDKQESRQIRSEKQLINNFLNVFIQHHHFHALLKGKKSNGKTEK